MSRYSCMECLGDNLDFPDDPEFDDLIVCKDCGAKHKYGEIRSTMETGQLDALPVAAVQEIDEKSA